MSIENNSTIEQSRNTPKGGEQSIPKGWVETTLGEVINSANTGLDAIKRAPIVEEETGVKCFRIQDASQKKTYQDWGNTKVEDRNYKRFKLTKGDILIARTGNSIGVHYLVKNNLVSVFNNGLIRLRTNEKADYEFLYKIVQSKLFQRYVQSIAYGTSTQPNMQINVLLGFNLLLPPLPEQVAIAQILTAFDDKIELLQAQNKTLETTDSS
jgi:type I restriction enzyme S subunit